MVSRAIADGFTSIVGAGSVLTKLEDIIPYSFDGTAALRQMPSAVVFPHSTGGVSRRGAFAVAQGVPIVTRGLGTGLSGGSVPTAGVGVFCVRQKNRILQIC